MQRVDSFQGLYTKTTGESTDSWKIAPNQFTLSDSNQLLPTTVAYGKNGVIEGDGSVYGNLNSELLYSGLTDDAEQASVLVGTNPDFVPGRLYKIEKDSSECFSVARYASAVYAGGNSLAQKIMSDWGISLTDTVRDALTCTRLGLSKNGYTYFVISYTSSTYGSARGWFGKTNDDFTTCMQLGTEKSLPQRPYGGDNLYCVEQNDKIVVINRPGDNSSWYPVCYAIDTLTDDVTYTKLSVSQTNSDFQSVQIGDRCVLSIQYGSTSTKVTGKSYVYNYKTNTFSINSDILSTSVGDATLSNPVKKGDNYYVVLTYWTNSYVMYAKLITIDSDCNITVTELPSQTATKAANGWHGYGILGLVGDTLYAVYDNYELLESSTAYFSLSYNTMEIDLDSPATSTLYKYELNNIGDRGFFANYEYAKHSFVYVKSEENGFYHYSVRALYVDTINQKLTVKGAGNNIGFFYRCAYIPISANNVTKVLQISAPSDKDINTLYGGYKIQNYVNGQEAEGSILSSTSTSGILLTSSDNYSGTISPEEYTVAVTTSEDILNEEVTENE